MKDPRNQNLPTFTPKTNFACLTALQPTNQTLFRIDFESAATNVTINWGDGTSPNFYAGPVTFVTHVLADTGTFTYTITEAGCATVTTGKFVNQYNTSTPGIGFVFPPAGTDNKRCTPTTIKLRNLSPNMNDFTSFIIDWGGLERKDTVYKGSYDQQIPHTYKPGSKLCRTRMTVTYQNLCGATAGQQPLSQSAGDYYFVERDSAKLNPSKIIICAPKDLTLTDASILNCLDTSGRKLRWTASVGFSSPLTVPGNGSWVSYNVTANKSLLIPASAFTPAPADSTFKVNMMIRNQCGADTAEATIFLAQPKSPIFSALNNNNCPGEVVQFSNTTLNQYPDGVLEYAWDWGDGSSVQVNNTPLVEHIFAIGGTYTVTLTCRVLTTISGQVCSRSRSVVINVKKNVTPILGISPFPVCQPGVVRIKNASVNTQNAVWKGWQLSQNPIWNGGSGFLPTTQAGQDTSLVAIRRTSVADSSVYVAFKKYGRYVISLSAQSAGCPLYNVVDTLDIYPTPTLRWKSTVKKICVGKPFQIRDSSVIFAVDSNGLPGVSFRNLTWQLNMGDTGRIQSQGPVTTNFDNPKLSNRITTYTYWAPGIYKVALTVFVGKNICPVSDTVIIQALPSPIPSFTFTKNRCENQKVHFINTTKDSASYYVFEVKRGNTVAASFLRTDRNAFDVLLPYVPPGDSTYYQVVLKAYTIASSGDTCISLSPSRRLSVAPTPVAAFVASQTDGCSPMLGVRFNNASFNMAVDTSNRFIWSFGNGQKSNAENPPLQDYINNTLSLLKDTVLFQITRKDGCIFSSTREILVFPSPNVSIVAIDSVCSGDSVHLSAKGNNLSQYIWSFTDYDQTNNYAPNPTKIFTNYTNNPKTYTIEFLGRTVYNCPQAVTKPIKIFPQPQVDIQLTPTVDKNCSPTQVKFEYLNAIGANKFTWYFGSNDSLTSTADTVFTKVFTNQTSSPIVRNVRLVATNGGACFTQVNRTITLNPEVRARFFINDSVDCSPVNLLLANNSSIGSDILVWSVGSSTFQNQQTLRQILNNPSHTRDTLISVQLVAHNSLAPSCRDTATKWVRIHPKPRIDGINAPTSTGCSPYIIPLSASGQGITGYRWDFGDGDTASDNTGKQSHKYENYNSSASKVYQARVVASNSFGCADTSRISITVKPLIQAGILTIDTAGCSPFVARFSSSGSINADRFSWTFGSQQQTNDANPNLTFVNNSDTIQLLPVRLIAEKLAVNGCPDTAYKLVRVYPKPTADFTLSTHIGCGPLPVQIANTSRLGQTFYWVISSGGVSDTVWNKNTIDTVFSNPNLVNKTIQIEIVVTSANGCVSAKRDFVTVYADVSAIFKFDTVGCSPFLVTIDNRSSNNGGSWLWEFGDGNSSSTRNPIHEFDYNNGAGDTTYTIKLTSVSSVGGCSRTDSAKVKVHGRPVNKFDIISPANRHLQLPANTATLQNNTAFYSQWHYKWLFQDGTIDTTRAQTFNHIYNFSFKDFLDTNFVITQIAYNDFGCSDTLRQSIIIQPEPPIPNFTYADSAGCSPLSVAFYNKSTYGREYLWDFGDKGISNERNPVHVYTRSGKYTVTLTVSGFGGVRSVTRDSVIYVQPFGSALFTSNPLFGQDVIIPETEVEFRPLYPCGSCTYLWDFGDGKTSDVIFPKHGYTEAGKYTVSLQVVSTNGCTSTDTVVDAVNAVDKTVLRAPTAFSPSKYGSNGGYISNSTDTKVFYPFTQGVVKIKMLIFNRWGQLMYQSTEVNRGWDGYYKGSVAPADTYVYRVEVTFNNGEVRQLVGDVTLIH